MEILEETNKYRFFVGEDYTLFIEDIESGDTISWNLKDFGVARYEWDSLISGNVNPATIFGWLDRG